MAACGSCSKKINRSQFFIVCSVCDDRFHGACVNMSESDVEFLKEGNRVWRCDDCQGARRKSMALEAAASEGDVTLQDVIKILNEMRMDNKKMEKNLGKSINFCHETIDELVKRIESQEKIMVEYCNKIEAYETEIKALTSKNEELESRLLESEQYSRRNCLEVHGVPHTPTEDPEDVIITVGRALGCEFKKDMIEACHRLTKKTKDGRPAPIIVKFIKRSIKEDILRKRRVKRDFSTRHMNLPSDEPVYINESLCPGRRAVFAAARKAKGDLGYKYLWVRGGTIFMRKQEGSSVIALKAMKDVSMLK